MGTQISLKLSEQMFSTANEYAEKHGFGTLQDFIRETMRERIFEEDQALNGLFTYKASEDTLAKRWLTKKEDKAWAHLQKER